MKSVQFLVDFNAVDGAGNSYTKFVKGDLYPLNEETARQVAAGHAQEVEDSAHGWRTEPELAPTPAQSDLEDEARRADPPPLTST